MFAAALLFHTCLILQSAALDGGELHFEVATIKPTSSDVSKGRYIRMESANRFVVRNYNLRRMVAAAYELNPHAVSGGPAWIDSDTFEVAAITPGDQRPAREQQMAMLQQLLAERCHLKFHREKNMLSAYVLGVAKGGPKLKETSQSPNEPEQLVATVFPDYVHLPARNATLGGLASMMQRGIFDRPVVDRTNLTGRYDFDLDWVADETQFSGELPKPRADAGKPGLLTALQEQLGLKLSATRNQVEVLVIDTVEKPSAN